MACWMFAPDNSFDACDTRTRQIQKVSLKFGNALCPASIGLPAADMAEVVAATGPVAIGAQTLFHLASPESRLLQHQNALHGYQVPDYPCYRCAGLPALPTRHHCMELEQAGTGKIAPGRIMVMDICCDPSLHRCHIVADLSCVVPLPMGRC